MERPNLSTVLTLISQYKGIIPKTEEYNIWEEMFREYNSDPRNKTLGRSCPPCYQKVFDYFNKKTE